MQAMALCECGQPLQHIERPTPVPTGAEVLVEVLYCGADAAQVGRRARPPRPADRARMIALDCDAAGA